MQQIGEKLRRPASLSDDQQGSIRQGEASAGNNLKARGDLLGVGRGQLVTNVVQRKSQRTHLGNGAFKLLDADEQQTARGLVLLPEVVACHSRGEREAEQETDEASAEGADGTLGLLEASRTEPKRGKEMSGARTSALQLRRAASERGRTLSEPTVAGTPCAVSDRAGSERAKDRPRASREGPVTARLAGRTRDARDDDMKRKAKKSRARWSTSGLEG